MTIGPREYRVLWLGEMHEPGPDAGQREGVGARTCAGSSAITATRWTWRRSGSGRRSSSRRRTSSRRRKRRSIARWASLWTVLAELQRERIAKALAPPEETALMTAEEQAAAMELLRDPRLLERVLEDFEQCGAVGEETNKKVSYLAAVSRLLAKPLAIVVQSSSSAGKSSLMEAVLDFMPEEQRESYTAMTGQALFYMGQKNLKHKILAIAEQQGAEARELSVEAVAVGRQAEYRPHRQRPGERQAWLRTSTRWKAR